MYKIIKYFDEAFGREVFAVVNKQTNQFEATFDTYDDANSYICSIH